MPPSQLWLGRWPGWRTGFLRTPSLEAAARRADRLLDLSDRLGTAWEFRNSRLAFCYTPTSERPQIWPGAGSPAETVHIWPRRSHFLPILVGLVLVGVLMARSQPHGPRHRAARNSSSSNWLKPGKEIQKTREESAGPDSSLSAEESVPPWKEALEKLEGSSQRGRNDARGSGCTLRGGTEYQLVAGAENRPRQSSSQDVGATLAASAYDPGAGAGAPLGGRSGSTRRHRSFGGTDRFYERGRASRPGRLPCSGRPMSPPAMMP